MKGGLEILTICFTGILVVLGFYFLPDISVDVFVPEAQADIANTSVTVSNVAPTVSGVSLNAGSNITLTENTTTTVTCVGTLTDNNGGADITSASSTIYRSGVGSSCLADDNNCYPIASANCTLGTVAGNDRPATCTADIWFHADPTDSGTYLAETWMCEITAIDAGGLTGASSTPTGVEMNTLLALDVTPTIGYGTLTPGETIDPLDRLAVATTTGNAAIDANISGTNMTYGANTIDIGQQRYATSSVNWASTTVNYVATTTATLLEFVTGKPTAHPSNQAQNTYWGIAVPSGQPVGDYTGENTYTVVAD